MSDQAVTGRDAGTFPRSIVLAIAACFLTLGVAGGTISCFGILQLAEIARSATPVSMNEMSIVGPVWNYFAPATGTVDAAEVASQVQTAFLALAGASLLVAGLGIFALWMACSSGPNDRGSNQL